MHDEKGTFLLILECFRSFLTMRTHTQACGRWSKYTTVADKVSIKSMPAKFQILSVNQLSAEIKLIDVWTSINVVDCPIQLVQYSQAQNPTDRLLRPQPNRVFNDSARLAMSQSSLNVDAAKVWNAAPVEVKQAVTLRGAKSAIKNYCKSLPI